MGGGGGHTTVSAPSTVLDPPPARTHPTSQPLSCTPKPCHSLPPPSKPAPRFLARAKFVVRGRNGADSHGIPDMASEGTPHYRWASVCDPGQRCTLSRLHSAARAPGTASPPPRTPCQRGWVSGALHKQPWHSRQHHICRPPPVHHRRRPPPAAHPLPPAQRSAHTRRLLHHHPAHPASEAGWVGHCTSSHGTAGSITSAGTPRSTTVADPRRQRTLSRLPSAARTRAACSTTTPHTLPANLGAWGTAQAALAQQAASHLQAPPVHHRRRHPPRQRTLSRLPSAARTRAACSTTTPHTLPARLGEWGTAQAAMAQQAASHLQAPPGPPSSPTPAGSAPSPACPAQRAHAPPAPPPPRTPCQRGWVGGALHKQPWHSRQHHICRHPRSTTVADTRPGSAPSPACPAQRAHAPPAPPPPRTPCQRGWVGGALHKQPWHSRQHHICRHPPVHHRRRPPPAAHPLPPAQHSAHTRRLLHHHPAHPASEAGWVGCCTSSPGTAWQRAAFATAGGVAAAAASPWLQLQTSCLQSTSSSVTYATREQCQSGLRTRRAHCSRCHLARGWRRAPAGAF